MGKRVTRLIGALSTTGSGAQTLFPDGSASAPSISFASSQTTGYYIPSPNNLRLAVNNITACSYNSAGVMQPGKAVWINENANANQTIGLTINQGANDNQAFTLKSSDVNTGITSIGQIASEVDDYAVLAKRSADNGGLLIQSYAETGVGTSLLIQAFSGAPQTTDTTSSLGCIQFDGIQHDGANAREDMAANSNLAAWSEIDSGGTRQTRMILKADDGELHLGNTTLVALDDYEDAHLVQTMRFESSTGIKDMEQPKYSYDVLRSIGVLGEKDENGQCLFNVQARFAMDEGAIWQLYKELSDTVERLTVAESKLAQLEA